MGRYPSPQIPRGASGMTGLRGVGSHPIPFLRPFDSGRLRANGIPLTVGRVPVSGAGVGGGLCKSMGAG